MQSVRGYKKYAPSFSEGQMSYDKWVTQMIIHLLEEKYSAKTVNQSTVTFLLKSEQWVLTDMFAVSWFSKGIWF